MIQRKLGVFCIAIKVAKSYILYLSKVKKEDWCVIYKIVEIESRCNMKDYTRKAKRVDNGEWIIGFYFCMVHDNGRHEHHFIIPIGADLSLGISIEKIQVEIDPDTICEPTGITDKNGNMIWENDFVKTDDGLIYKIFWHKSFFRLSGSLQDENNHLGSRFWLNLWEIKNIRCKEVIGNCFDNLELIGE